MERDLYLDGVADFLTGRMTLVPIFRCVDINADSYCEGWQDAASGAWPESFVIDEVIEGVYVRVELADGGFGVMVRCEGHRHHYFFEKIGPAVRTRIKCLRGRYARRNAG